MYPLGNLVSGMVGGYAIERVAEVLYSDSALAHKFDALIVGSIAVLGSSLVSAVLTIDRKTPGMIGGYITYGVGTVAGFALAIGTLIPLEKIVDYVV